MGTEGEKMISTNCIIMRILALTSITGLLILSGCVSTPQSRADENPDLFESFTAAQKEAILKGEVDLEFTPEMVRMAAGMPDRRAKKRSSKGTSEVWTYYEYYPRSIYGYGGYGRYFSYNRLYGGWYRNSYWGGDIVVARHGEREKNLVVEFQEGKVISFEMVQ